VLIIFFVCYAQNYAISINTEILINKRVYDKIQNNLRDISFQYCISSNNEGSSQGEKGKMEIIKPGEVVSS
jgi:hypothetical protein